MQVAIRLHTQDLHLPFYKTQIDMDQLPLIIFYCLLIHVKVVSPSTAYLKKKKYVHPYQNKERQGLHLLANFLEIKLFNSHLNLHRNNFMGLFIVINIFLI